MLCLFASAVTSFSASQHLTPAVDCATRSYSLRSSISLVALSTANCDHKCPDQFSGPWEMCSSFSGYENFWVELQPDGTLSCSHKIGRGKEWHAEPIGESWLLSMTVLDKLSRPLTLKGLVRTDEYREQVVTGDVLGPPRRGSTESTAKLAEFRGFKLN